MSLSLFNIQKGATMTCCDLGGARKYSWNTNGKDIRAEVTAPRHFSHQYFFKG